MMTGIIQDQNLEKQIEKQMGCMSGFLQLFDRQQILSGKRMYSTKRLPPSTGVTSSPEPVKLVESPAVSREFTKLDTPRTPVVPASSERFQQSPAKELRSPSPAYVLDTPPKSPLPLPIFELKDGMRTSWKFCKEAPRLSLDSRAIVDAKGSLHPREIRTDSSVLSANRCNNNNSAVDGDDKNRRSPSVIARLMGLEPLPSISMPEAVKKPELRRSASESRVSRDVLYSRFMDHNNFQQPQCAMNISSSNTVRNNVNVSGSNRAKSNVVRAVDSMDYSSRNVKSGVQRSSPWRSPQQRRSFFDSTDFFPEPKQTTTATIYGGEFEKRFKMRGIDEQSKDLETWKQILEALQLKGLLHSKKPSKRNFVYDRSFASEESPIVLMKPWRSPGLNNAGIRHNVNVTGESIPSVSPRRERAGADRSPVRSRNSASSRSSNSIIKSKSLIIETQKRLDELPEQRRTSSPIHSPKLTPKRFGSDQGITNRSPRIKKSTSQIQSKQKISTGIVTEDESSSISESTISGSSHTDTERMKNEEYREGRSLLERCDKLLNSIAEMNSNESQPSPVSVLDSSFYKDESSSPSPVMKRSIDFKDSELEDEIWSPAISPVKTPTYEEEITSEDSDFVYISDILRASRYLPEDSDIFLLLEKQPYLKGKDNSKSSILQRKLLFDVVVEILDRSRQLPPWKEARDPSLRQVWSEFQSLRERETAEDLLELVCSVLRKDLARINGWEDQPVEMSEAVLDIERLIFKDLVSETIRDLAEFAGKSTGWAPRRKLVF